MGTTLSNGVYLPDEGERNCYAGLKVNWEILNQKVADISALQSAIAGALHREIVESLPTTDIDPNTIYMILSGTSATENVYNEFMYVNNAWELIGTSATDLTNYYTKGDVDGLLVLKANASDLTSHTGDTTIHVTASDKTKWTNSANTHVLRLAKSALTPSSSTNAFSNLDDSTALKVGDKVMDTAGVLFEVTAIDTANSTFTIGTALIDLAQDSDVVHKSGDETVGGEKTFSNLQIIRYGTQYKGSRDAYILPEFSAGYSGLSITTLGFAQTLKIGNFVLDANNKPSLDTSKGYIQIATGENNNVNTCVLESRNSTSSLLGTSSNRWSKIYGTEYYYGSNNVEFSTKFVTTDTNQTISGVKSFIDYFLGKNLSGQTVDLNDCVDAYSGAIHYYYAVSNYTNISNKPENKPFILESKTVRYVSSIDYIYYQKIYTADYNASPSIYTRYYRSGSASWSNWIKDTDKFVTTDTNQTISGNKTFSSINGVEPSSLSLPVAPSSTSFIDISSYITDTTGAVNNFTPPANGYITFSATGTQVQIFSDYGLQSKFSIQAGSAIRGYHPVLKNEAIKIYIIASSIDFFRFIPCQGNV